MSALAGLGDFASKLLVLAATPEGQTIIKQVLERPDTTQAQLEASLKTMKTADWPDDPPAEKKE